MSDETPIIVDLIDPAMTADLERVTFSMTLSDETKVDMAIPVEHLTGLTTTFLNYALVADDRRRKAGVLKHAPHIRTDIAPTPATGIGFAQTPDGRGAVVLVFGAAQIVVPLDATNLRRLAGQSLELADVLDGAQPSPEAPPETPAETPPEDKPA